MAWAYQTLAIRTSFFIGTVLLILGAVFLAKDKAAHHHHPASSSSASSGNILSTINASSLSDVPIPMNQDQASIGAAAEPPVSQQDTIASSGSDKAPEGFFSSQDHQQKGVVATQARQICSVANAQQLNYAVQNAGCSIIRLTSNSVGAYVLTDEIVVSRAVVIQGSSALLPLIDGSHVVRCFRVKSGASLELENVRLAIGHGVMRTQGPRKILELRGGGVLFEPGALTGTFIGVFFLQEQELHETLDIIGFTLDRTGGRIYGGSIFMAGGSLTCIGCLFLRADALLPLTDWIFIGGDILVLAGEATFTGCVFNYITAIGITSGLGNAVAMFGGVTNFALCNLMEMLLAGAFNGMGQAFWVGGGVQIITGCHFSYYQAIMLLTGTGDLTVAAGVQIATGTAVETAYGIAAGFADCNPTTVDYLTTQPPTYLPTASRYHVTGVQIVTGTAVETAYGVAAGFGIGFSMCNIAGLMVQTGVSLRQWSGAFWGLNAGGFRYVNVGGFSYVGAGELIVIGCEVVATNGVGGEEGLGGYYAVAAGTAIFIGVPSFDIVGIWTVQVLGEFLGVGAGLIIWLGVPTFKIKGIEGFTGKGGVMFVGVGIAVLGYSPLTERIGRVNEHADFFIGGSCEQSEGGWAGGPPFFVRPGQGGRPGCVTPVKSGGRRGLAAASSTSTTTATSTSTLPSSSSPTTSNLRLVAMNMERRKDWGLVDPSSISPGTLKMAQGYDQELQPFHAYFAASSKDTNLSSSASFSSSSSSTNHSLFYINEPMASGSCSLCNVDSLSGPGADSCVSSSSCLGGPDQFDSAHLLKQRAQAQNQSVYYLVLTNLRPTTKANTSLDTKTLSTALRKSLLNLNVLEDSDEISQLQALQVNTFSTQASEPFSTMYPSLVLDETSKDPVFPATHHFQAVVVTTAKALANTLINAFGDGKDEGKGGSRRGLLDEEHDAERADPSTSSSGATELTAAILEDGVRSYLLEEQGIDVGAVGLSYVDTYKVPIISLNQSVATSPQSNKITSVAPVITLHKQQQQQQQQQQP